MCKILLEKGSDITHLDNNGKNVVEYAKKAKFIETAEFLAN
jgi:ankyrin repeat protein